MLISKGITLLSNTAVFNDDIKDWNRLDAKEKMWANFKTHFQRAHRECRKAVTTAGQGGYNALVHNVYGYNATVNNVYGNAEDDAVCALSSKLPLTPSAPSREDWPTTSRVWQNCRKRMQF
eukprot:scaffold82631_cov31-Attheya_sp.AAC.1